MTLTTKSCEMCRFFERQHCAFYYERQLCDKLLMAYLFNHPFVWLSSQYILLQNFMSHNYVPNLQVSDCHIHQVHFSFCHQMNERHQLSRPPHLPRMPGTQLTTSQVDGDADAQGDRLRPAAKVAMPHVRPGVVSADQDEHKFRNPTPKVGLPHVQTGVVASSQGQGDHLRNLNPKVGLPHVQAGIVASNQEQGDHLQNPNPKVGLPHVQAGVVASSQGDQAITNGNGAPSVRHSVPSLHPAPRLGLPHASGVTVSQTLPPGTKPPATGFDYNSKTASLDRSKDPTPPPVPAKPDKKRHSVLGIFKKSKKDKEK